ncbi:hypothetical protein [Anabaena sp. UHCC 0399]|uniref:hypothetical protein n=1 Tax=Anabaena sp. UHCC 0399 TaxID=3110238 RepID=UPI002B1F7192|nr:hypothetical protein [Anabaena sp. UHCC 0399]MEA5568704.1 hypothetical protein [Anabaena sp. UHCC 0399]
MSDAFIQAIAPYAERAMSTTMLRLRICLNDSLMLISFALTCIFVALAGNSVALTCTFVTLAGNLVALTCNLIVLEYTFVALKLYK